MLSASSNPNRCDSAGVYGNDPTAFCTRMGRISKYARADVELSTNGRAFALTATTPNPAGIMKPFCEPAMEKSTPHSSALNARLPMELMPSTNNNAG